MPASTEKASMQRLTPLRSSRCRRLQFEKPGDRECRPEGSDTVLSKNKTSKQYMYIHVYTQIIGIYVHIYINICIMVLLVCR